MDLRGQSSAKRAGAGVCSSLRLAVVLEPLLLPGALQSNPRDPLARCKGAIGFHVGDETLQL